MQTAYEAKLYRHVVKYVQNLEKVDKASSDDEKLKELTKKQLLKEKILMLKIFKK